jgi:hypothetical protein
MINLSKVKTLLKQIEDCDCIVVGDSPYLHSCEVSGTPGDEEYENEEILKFNWDDGEGQMFEAVFSEKNLSDAEINDNIISLNDIYGEKTEIKLYSLTPEPVVII